MGPFGAAAPRAQVSGFRDVLARHLLAFEERDIDALAATVADDAVLFVTADGRLTQSKSDFVEAHRAWFAMKNWRLEIKPVQIIEGGDSGVALLRLNYREMQQPGQPPSQQQSLQTLVFQNRNGRWALALNQNTPVK
jgi:uncharacterized protein (TIGR02246 family)